MGCTCFEGFVEPYLSGDLTGKDRERFEKHLDECGTCREELNNIQALNKLLEQAALRKVNPPPYLTEKIMARLTAEQRSRSRTWRFLHPVAAILLLTVAIGLGYMIRDTTLQDQPVPSRYQQVRIIFFSPDASSVALVGDFNEWGQRDVTVAGTSDSGIWEFTLTLKPGVYHYNLLVDGIRWVANPKAATLVPDGFGGYNSVLVVSEKCQDDCA